MDHHPVDCVVDHPHVHLRQQTRGRLIPALTTSILAGQGPGWRLGPTLLALLAGLAAEAAPTGTLVAAAGTEAAGVELRRNTLATADFGDARLRATEQRVLLRGAPRPMGEAEFRWALDYGYQRFEYQGLPSRNRDLHRLELPLAWRGDAALSWVAEIRPVIASSSNVFQEIWSRGGSDDFLWHGRVLAGHAPGGPRWGWQLGLARDDAFGRERAYPLAALLRQHQGVTMEIGWPVTRAMIELGRGVAAGGELAPAGARWHVVSDEREGASFDYEARAWRAGAILRWQTVRRLALHTRAGLEFERRHHFEDDTGARVNRAVGEAAYLELGVGYRW